VLATKRGRTSGLAKPRVDDRVDLVLTEKAVSWIDTNHTRPFFLYFTPVAVHNPVTPNKQFRGQSQCGIYGDYIRELDWCVGQILESLERNKIADNTLVFFTSDNGGVVDPDGEAAEFRLTLENDEDGAVTKHYQAAQSDAYRAGHRPCGNLRGRKHSVFEGGNRVPFIARWPGKVPAGATSDEIVGLTDLLATVAGVVGEKLPATAGEDSYDIGPALFGKKPASPIREALIVQNSEGVFALRQGPWKFIAQGAAADAPPNSPWTKEGARDRLFHLGNDLEETTDVIDKHPDIAATLGKLLKQYREQGFSRPGAAVAKSQ
jgi:arylsulfatase A-like enzyme